MAPATEAVSVTTQLIIHRKRTGKGSELFIVALQVFELVSELPLFSTTCFHLPSTVTTALYSFAIQLVAG